MIAPKYRGRLAVKRMSSKRFTVGYELDGVFIPLCCDHDGKISYSGMRMDYSTEKAAKEVVAHINEALAAASSKSP